MPKLPGIKGFDYKRLADSLFDPDPKVNSRVEKMIEDYKMRAQAEKDAGTRIRINRMMPSIEISFADDPEGGYFFDGEEADRLLAEVPEWINAETYILAQLVNW